jgi:hypothetical protein
MCCGKKRAELRNSPPATRTQAPSQSVPNSTPSPTVPPRTYGKAPVGTVQRPAPNQASRPATLHAEVPAAVSNSNGSVMVQYVDHSPIRVRGLQTGRTYEFSGTHGTQAVDARDAATLLATRFFRRG